MWWSVWYCWCYHCSCTCWGLWRCARHELPQRHRWWYRLWYCESRGGGQKSTYIEEQRQIWNRIQVRIKRGVTNQNVCSSEIRATYRGVQYVYWTHVMCLGFIFETVLFFFQFHPWEHQWSVSAWCKLIVCNHTTERNTDLDRQAQYCTDIIQICLWDINQRSTNTAMSSHWTECSRGWRNNRQHPCQAHCQICVQQVSNFCLFINCNNILRP